MTLDTVVKNNGFPGPDLIKINCQGAELDILKGASDTLKSCKDLILTLQHNEINVGAPLKDEVIDYVNNLGFKLAIPTYFSVEGDNRAQYHFTRK